MTKKEYNAIIHDTKIIEEWFIISNDSACDDLSIYKVSGTRDAAYKKMQALVFSTAINEEKKYLEICMDSSKMTATVQKYNSHEGFRIIRAEDVNSVDDAYGFTNIRLYDIPKDIYWNNECAHREINRIWEAGSFLKEIADWITETGLELTTDGKYPIYFKNVGKEFGLSSKWIKEHSSEICKQFNTDIVNKCIIDDEKFEMCYHLRHCCYHCSAYIDGNRDLDSCRTCDCWDDSFTMEGEYPLLSEKTKNLLKNYFPEEDTFSGLKRYKGFFLEADKCYSLAVLLGWTECVKAKGIAGDVFNKNELFHLSWVKGEVYFIPFKNLAEYEKELKRIKKWYAEEK